MDQFRSPNALSLMKLAPDPTLYVHKAQVIAMMLQPGVIEVQSSLTERIAYTAGDVVLCRRHVDEVVRCDEGIQALCFVVSDAVLRETAGEKSAKVELQSASRLEDVRIKALMAAANSERIAGFPSGRLFLEAVEVALAAVLVRGYAIGQHSFCEYRGGLTPACLRNVLAFVRSQIGEDLSLEKMAEVAGFSVTHFSAMFRESVGESPHQFVLQQRVKRAKELLRARELRILDVALECGFKTQQHFTRVFRNTQGVTPTEYRRQILR